MSTGRVLQLFVLLLGIARCKGKYFVIDGLNTSDISALTTALEVGGEFRYPCYVSVVVYTSPAVDKVYKGAKVYVLTRSREDKQKYYGYSESTTNDYGQACLLTLCRKEALIYVEAGSNNERLFSVGQSNQRLPPGYTFNTDTNSQYIIFNVRNWGVVYGKSGPVYNLEEKTTCENAKADHNHFRFSFISIPEELTGADLTTHLQLMSWYYPYPLTDTYQVCYMKIKVITPLYQAKVSLQSLEASSMKLFGTYSAGPKSLPSALDSVQKAACMEFRCASRDNTFGTEVVMNTTVIGWVSGSSVRDCRIVGNAKLKEVDSNATYFKTTVRANDNYGASFGIYKNSDKETAKSMCYTGKDHLINGYTMDPNTNYFISFDCTSQDKIVDMILVVPSCARFFEINWRNTTDVKRFQADVDYRDRCVASVRACRTIKCTDIYTNATVYVLSRNATNGYMGYDFDETVSNGRACVLTACNHNADVFVRSQPDSVKDFELMFTTNGSQILPDGYLFSISQMNQLINFNVINRGTISIGGIQKTGPIYDTVSECRKATTTDYTFDFFFQAQQEILRTNIPLNIHHNELSWYYVEPAKNTYESCFLKIKIKSFSSRQCVATLVSMDLSDEWYGTYTVGAKSSLTSRDQELKAACVEYRCPVHDEKGRLKDTNIIGSVSVMDTTATPCKVSGGFGIRETVGNATHFSVTIHADENYGSFYGVYKHRDRETGKAMCLTGQNFLYPSFKINPKSHAFASFDCASSPVTIGK